MIVIDEYLAVRVVCGAWPDLLPDSEDLGRRTQSFDWETEIARERRRSGLESAEPLGHLGSCGRPVGENVDREIVEGEVEDPGQGDDGEEGRGWDSSCLDLAEGLDRDTSGDGHLAQAC
jgi:hypothetical protein